MSYHLLNGAIVRLNRRERRAYAAGRWARWNWLRRDFFRRWLKDLP